jgi:hypothetical protein
MRVMILIALLSGCTTPGQVHDLETDDFQRKGGAQDGQIGINGSNQVVIRENKAADDELAVTDLVNTHLRDNVEHDLADLKNCENQLNDPRLGGSGRVTQSPDIEKLKSVPEIREDMGLDESGDLRVVQEQSFDERLKAERKFSETLKKMDKVAKQQNEECQAQLVIVREQHGLQGSPYKASGYFTGDGTWVETQHGEQSLDDAFAISAKAKANNQPSH